MKIRYIIKEFRKDGITLTHGNTYMSEDDAMHAILGLPDSVYQISKIYITDDRWTAEILCPRCQSNLIGRTGTVFSNPDKNIYVDVVRYTCVSCGFKW